MYVLGTQATSPFRFVIFSLLISLLFSSIIYTIVCILGNVGKAVCIILLVLQLGSSGGNIPDSDDFKILPNIISKSTIHLFNRITT